MISVFPLPAFRDNYIWVARHDDGSVLVVDPGDAAVVEDYLQDSGSTLTAILLTHHHADHIGGVEALLRRHPVPVYGPREARMPMVSHTLADGEVLELPGMTLEVLAVPGHTREHIAFYCARPDTADVRPLVFCGDTLFAAGCGRMFEGTPPVMHASLERLAALPGKTLVYCTHEYTLSNLAFARHLLPTDATLDQRTREESAKREQGRPTLPSSIALERATNPFLRCDDPAVQAAAGATGRPPAEVFGALRRMKDEF